MRCFDCEFRNLCDESETVLTSFVSCEKRNMLKSLKSAPIEAVNPNANVSFEKSAGEDFRSKTERIISELSGMIGNKCHYGEMVGAPAPYCGCGPMVYENPEDYSLEKAVDILKRMLNGDWELEEKLADEMFSDLGYSGTPSGCYNSLNGEKSIRFFSKEEAPNSIPFVLIELNGKYEVCVSFDEISAIVQTIKEMKEMEEIKNERMEIF